MTSQSLPVRSLTAFIKAYQYLISPWLGERCRFYPSCSEYAQEALRAHGFFTGSILTVKRMLRCHPFSKGGLDPVPHKNKEKF